MGGWPAHLDLKAITLPWNLRQSKDLIIVAGGVGGLKALHWHGKSSQDKTKARKWNCICKWDGGMILTTERGPLMRSLRLRGMSWVTWQIRGSGCVRGTPSLPVHMLTFLQLRQEKVSQRGSTPVAPIIRSSCFGCHAEAKRHTSENNRPSCL